MLSLLISWPRRSSERRTAHADPVCVHSFDIFSAAGLFCCCSCRCFRAHTRFAYLQYMYGAHAISSSESLLLRDERTGGHTPQNIKLPYYVSVQPTHTQYYTVRSTQQQQHQERRQQQLPLCTRLKKELRQLSLVLSSVPLAREACFSSKLSLLLSRFTSSQAQLCIKGRDDKAGSSRNDFSLSL